MNVMIAGGGTGGHLFPGIAVAEEFLRRNREVRILFVGTDRGIEMRLLGKMGFALKTINVEGVKGRGWMKSMAAVLRVPVSLMQSVRIIREFSPDIVIGVGGYASGPAVMAAGMLGIKTVIAEQNAFPGLTNRILGRFADKVFVSFAESGRWFDARKVVVTGNPIRQGFTGNLQRQESEKRPFELLVFGGSQGAHALNMALPPAIEKLAPLHTDIRIVHQTGDKDFDAVVRAYRERGVTAEVMPFIVDMVSAYQSADLLVCRAGATTIAEITAAGKAAVLIPFPAAVDDHQTKNAQVLADAGAAEMIAERELSETLLAQTIRKYYDNPELLKQMGIRSASLGNVRAANDIVDICEQLMRKKKGKG